MGGAPIFLLFREALPAAKLMRFRGILNSTTNLILTEMEHGNNFDAAVKKAQDHSQRRLRRHRRDQPQPADECRPPTAHLAGT